VATSELFDNLKGLKNASDYKLSYIFTSFREFKDLLPKVYEEKSMMYFTDTWYVKPALKEDMKAIIFAFEKQYGLTLSTQIKELITKLSGGHVQYLQICLIILFELSKKGVLKETDVESSIVSDERITLQSEELWDSLNTAEQEIVKKVVDGKKLSKHDFEIGKYVWDIGLLSDKVGTLHVFSPLFIPYAKEVTTTNQTEVFEFTKKEMVLFQFLQERIGEVCEREKIIERVWPEYNEAGISDWSIDKLVARLREKISKQGNGYKIQTVRTRGYKLVKD
jgi:DNA-binding winged helix-turn-helix (wHTH) protein